MNNNAVEVTRVTKRYAQGKDWLTVLDDVSLTIAAKEFVAVSGPSGAGKSTLLHLIGGLDFPTEGQVSLEGQSWSSLSAQAQARLRNQRIGFVFQAYHLLPELTAFENVMLPAMLGPEGRSRRQIGERAKNLLDRVGLAARLEHRPSELSGGEQQRVAIARSLMNSPRMLLCDEPTGNLDTGTGEAVLELLKQWHREQSMTLCIVTHETSVAKAAQRIIQMRDGKVMG
ncbi:MAG: ABC transporter ATP-binding protein [Candidatus Omnitrophica bacterium]|nr:ABC transporter ATP-binding protein [Candidatus Omnitrophota bacterium]